MISAAILTGARRIELTQVELPKPGAGDVVVEVAACAICATNLHAWSDPEHALRGSELPGAQGHELAGIVQSAGEDVRSVSRGDRVCLDPVLACACGACGSCLDGDALSCTDRSTLPVWGFAESIVVPARGVVVVPDALELTLACLAEPLAAALHGIRSSWTASPHGRIDGVGVVVIGAGIMGLFAGLAARTLGAREVTIVARHPHQARAADAMGLESVLTSDPDHERAIRGLRPRLVVEAAGGDGSALATALATVERGGEVVVLGLFDRPPALDVSRAVLRNVHTFFASASGALGGVSDFSLALDILAGSESLGGLITGDLPLTEIAEAFRLASDRSAGSLRVVVRPGSAILPTVC